MSIKEIKTKKTVINKNIIVKKYNFTDVPETVKTTVAIQGETKKVTYSTADSVMQTLERNEIAVSVCCRSDEYEFCCLHLIESRVYVPKNMEYRRPADYKFNCILPCRSFPLTDIILDAPVAK